jgi:hypothetical protein
MRDEQIASKDPYAECMKSSEQVVSPGSANPSGNWSGSANTVQVVTWPE